MKNDRLPLSKALIIIFLSTVLVSGSATLAWLYWQHTLTTRATDDRYLVRWLIHTGPDQQQLPAELLMQLMDLSADPPVNLYGLDTEQMRKALLRYPLIKTAKVEKRHPDTVYLDYSLKEPVALIGEHPDIGVDRYGTPIPIQYMQTQRSLPIFWLGVAEDNRDLLRIQQQYRREIALGLSLIVQLADLLEVDLRQLHAPVYGLREIVVRHNDDLLRLNPNDIRQGLANYLTLSKVEPFSSSSVIDLRIPNLAFVREEDCSETSPNIGNLL